MHVQEEHWCFASDWSWQLAVRRKLLASAAQANQAEHRQPLMQMFLRAATPFGQFGLRPSGQQAPALRHGSLFAAAADAAALAAAVEVCQHLLIQSLGAIQHPLGSVKERYP